jgi:hypothetical protein
LKASFGIVRSNQQAAEIEECEPIAHGKKLSTGTAQSYAEENLFK